MTISFKSNEDGVSGSIQVNGTPVVTVTASKITVPGTIEFPDASTQTTAGATTGKAIAMSIVFGG